jgi:mRNA interferase HigB
MVDHLCLFRYTNENNPLDPVTGAGYNLSMRIISRKCLKEFWETHHDARQSLQAWLNDIKRAEWKSPQDIKDVYRNASFLANNRVVFNIKGNCYRLVVVVQYTHGILYIRFVGTHGDYDRIDAATI